MDDDDYKALSQKKIPIAFYYGDYIGQNLPNVPAASMWYTMRSTAYTFENKYKNEGLACTIYNLPDEGIYGNDHMMFQDLNNDVIADHIENWITSKIYNGKTNLASFLKFNFITRYLRLLLL